MIVSITEIDIENIRTYGAELARKVRVLEARLAEVMPSLRERVRALQQHADEQDVVYLAGHGWNEFIKRFDELNDPQRALDEAEAEENNRMCDYCDGRCYTTTSHGYRVPK